MENLRKI